MEGEFHAPSIGEFFPGESANEFIWEDTITGGWFSLDRIMLVRLLVAAIMITFFVVAMRKPKIIPSGLQNGEESAAFLLTENFFRNMNSDKVEHDLRDVL